MTNHEQEVKFYILDNDNNVIEEEHQKSGFNLIHYLQQKTKEDFYQMVIPLAIVDIYEMDCDIDEFEEIQMGIRYHQIEQNVIISLKIIDEDENYDNVDNPLILKMVLFQEYHSLNNTLEDKYTDSIWYLHVVKV